MAIVKVIGVIAKSPGSWEHAAEGAVTEAAKSVHGIKQIEIKHVQGPVEYNRMVKYRVNAHVSLVVD